jgi:putative tryptophan/tyrosine transport system substrate-binding protein
MKRRQFIAVVGAAAVWPLAVQAQRPAMPVIAVLGSGAMESSASVTQMTLMAEGMHELGLTQGRDYAFEARWADSDSSRFPTLARELLARQPKMVVVSTILAAKAVQDLSKTLPIVMSGLNDPVAAGLVASLAHPGGNITGVSTMAEDLLLKLIELLRQTLPDVHKIAVLTNPTNPSHRPMLDTLARQASKDGIDIATIRVASSADLDGAFAALSREQAGALVILNDASIGALVKDIAARALSQGVPAAGFNFGLAQSGALLAYSRDPKDSYRSVARYLKKILDGADPANLPIEQPTKFQLSINLGTARTLGIVVPAVLLATADEVIE